MSWSWRTLPLGGKPAYGNGGSWWIKKETKDKKENNKKISISWLEGHAEGNRWPLFALSVPAGIYRLVTSTWKPSDAFSSDRWSEVVSLILVFVNCYFLRLVYFFLLSVWNSIVAVCLTAFLHFAFSSPIFIRMLHDIYMSAWVPTPIISICLKINLNKIYVFGISYRIRKLKKKNTFPCWFQMYKIMIHTLCVFLDF